MKRGTRKLKIVERLNERIITVLEEPSTMLQSKGEIFRSRAYKKALETIMCLDKDILDVTKIKGLDGIGSSIYENIKEYFIPDNNITILWKSLQ